MKTLANITYILFIIFFTYFILYLLYQLALTIIAIFEGRRRYREYKFEDYRALASSVFSLPVSLIIPAHNEEDWVLDSVKSALNLNYPEFEIIIVEDGSTDDTMGALRSEFKLEAIDRFPEKYFPCGRVREVFKSRLYPNITVISKAGGFKKAGAVNVGLEFARYSYVCVVDADTILEPDALLKVMAHVDKDAENIIGIGSYFGLLNGFKIKDGKIIKHSFSYNPLVAYQNLEYIRTFILNRTAWSKFNASPNIAGGFGIWRRDILLELGGFSTETSSEDIEFTFRAQDYILEKGRKGYKILNLPYVVGWTEGPDTLNGFLQQRDRWQRVINETMWKYKHVIFSPGHGIFAFLTVPYYMLYESLGVFFEVISLGLILAGWIAGVLQLKVFLAFFALIVFSQALISLLSLFAFTREQKIFSLRDVLYFVFLSFVEFFWYHWLMLIAKVLGTFSYLSGIKTYDQYKRTKR